MPRTAIPEGTPAATREGVRAVLATPEDPGARGAASRAEGHPAAPSGRRKVLTMAAGNRLFKATGILPAYDIGARASGTRLRKGSEEMFALVLL